MYDVSAYIEIRGKLWVGLVEYLTQISDRIRNRRGSDIECSTIIDSIFI